MKTIAIALLLIATTQAEENHRGADKKWISSMLALAGANVLDVHSSMGRYEANPLLRTTDGRFDVNRGAFIKIGASGSFLAVQWFLHRKHRSEGLDKAFTVTNSVLAGVVARTAFQNYRLPSDVTIATATTTQKR